MNQGALSFNEAERSQDLPSAIWLANKITDVVQFESGSLRTRRPRMVVLTRIRRPKNKEYQYPRTEEHGFQLMWRTNLPLVFSSFRPLDRLDGAHSPQTYPQQTHPNLT